MGSAQGQVLSELEQARTAPEFGARTPLSEKLLAVAIRAQNFTGSTGVAIALTEDEQMVCRASWGTSAPEVGATLSLEHSFTGLCVRAGEPLRCDDAQKDPRVDPEACQTLGISAIAAAPVRRGLKVIGVIAAFSDTPNAFTDKHLLILTTLSEVVVELLDDPHPVQPLPQAVEAPSPDLGRAAGIVQASGASLVDKASVATTVLQEPAAPPVQAEPVFLPLPPLTPTQPEPPLDAAPAEAAETTPDAPQPQRPEPAPTAIASFITVPATAPPSAPGADKPRDRALNWAEAPPKKDEVLPAAMDPALPPQPSKTEESSLSLQPAKTTHAGDAGTARPTLIKRTQPAPAPLPDLVSELRFSGVEADKGTARRWLLPAAILAIFAIIAFAAWRLHVAKSVRKANPVPASQASEPQPAPAPQPEQAQQDKPLEPAPADPKHSPFSAPTIAEGVPSPVRIARPAEQPADVTVRHSPQPVVEVDRPVRRPEAGGGVRKPQVPDAQAPQLALSTPDLPAALARPAPITVVGPVSRFVPARVLQRVEPVYPETARRLKISGRIVVKATITKSGSVADVEWVSGSELFRDNAITAVKQWRFQPASLNGQPTESDLEIVLQFNRPNQ